VKDHATFFEPPSSQISCTERLFVIAGEGNLIDSMRSLASELGIGSSTSLSADVRMWRITGTVGCLCVELKLRGSRIQFWNTWPRHAVVVTDVGGAREAVLNGRQVIWFAAEIISRWPTDCIITRPPRSGQRNGRNGRTLVERKFSCDRQVESVERLYQHLFESAQQQDKKQWAVTRWRVSSADGPNNSGTLR